MVLKRLALVTAVGLVCAGCAGSDVAPDAAHLGAEVAPEHEVARDVLLTFERASNAHDLGTLEALFTPDATWYREDVAVYSGREEVLGPFAYDEATAAHFILENIVFDGPRVRCDIVESNDFFVALGVESIRQSVEFELQGHQIRAVHSLRREQTSRGEKTVARFLDWLARERREDFLRLMTASFDERADLARELIDAAASWTAAGQPG